jgi:hypothetical protein
MDGQHDWSMQKQFMDEYTYIFMNRLKYNCHLVSTHFNSLIFLLAWYILIHSFVTVHHLKDQQFMATHLIDL